MSEKTLLSFSAKYTIMVLRVTQVIVHFVCYNVQISFGNFVTPAGNLK